MVIVCWLICLVIITLIILNPPLNESAEEWRISYPAIKSYYSTTNSNNKNLIAIKHFQKLLQPPLINFPKSALTTYIQDLTTLISDEPTIELVDISLDIINMFSDDKHNEVVSKLDSLIPSICRTSALWDHSRLNYPAEQMYLQLTPLRKEGVRCQERIVFYITSLAQYSILTDELRPYEIDQDLDVDCILAYISPTGGDNGEINYQIITQRDTYRWKVSNGYEGLLSGVEYIGMFFS